MSATAVFEDRVEPGQVASALLSAVVHVLLLAVLINNYTRLKAMKPETAAYKQ